MEIPVCILRGNESQGEFYSIAIANNMQQADTGYQDGPLGQKHQVAHRLERDFSAGKGAEHLSWAWFACTRKPKTARNFTQCDSLADRRINCGAHTVPYIEVKNNSARVEHEATTSKVDDEQLFYCRQRGIG